MGHVMGLRLETLNVLQQMEQESDIFGIGLNRSFGIGCVVAERRDVK
jgi:hypothetical protein